MKKRPTVFDSLFDSNLPPQEKSTWRLTSEGAMLMAAGTETVSWTLAVLTFYILSRPEILSKLTEELQTVVSDSRNLPSWSKLERLPLLHSVILEGLRLSYGVSIRSSRVATEEDLIYHGAWTPPSSSTPVSVDYVIPRGSPIGMTTWMTHHDEALFINSDEFKPDRFLDERGEKINGLDKYVTAFSKGSRVCLGMQYVRTLPPRLLL